MDGNSAQSFDPDRHPPTQRRSRLAATPQARDCALANRTPFAHGPYALTGSTALRRAVQSLQARPVRLIGMQPNRLKDPEA
ncbi:hypothetical protein BM1_00920 [Bipolaris maydis]|nr:hypothetical protein BM1_00920 [Bipolaris maydis]